VRARNVSESSVLALFLVLFHFKVPEFAKWIEIVLPTRRYVRAVLAMARCPSVCPSVTRRYCIETAERIELVFGTEAILGSSYTVLTRITPNITAHPSGTLSQTLDLEKLRHGTSTVASVVNLVRPTTIACLSHWASTFVYNTMAVTQGVARVRRRYTELVVWRLCYTFSLFCIVL